MKKVINYTIGFVFIVPGIFILLAAMNIFNIANHVSFITILKNYWPFLLIMLPGLYLHLLFYTSDRHTPAVLILAGSITFFGLIIQISYSFSLWSKLWPALILSFAVGFIEYYLFFKKERIVLIAAVIIAGISAILFLITLRDYSILEYIVAIALIILGLVIILGNEKKIHGSTNQLP